MAGIKMWAIFLDNTRDLEHAAFYRLEDDAKEHRKAWHGEDSPTFIEPVIITLIKGESNG